MQSPAATAPAPAASPAAAQTVAQPAADATPDLATKATDAIAQEAKQLTSDAAQWVDKGWDLTVKYGPAAIKVLVILVVAWLISRTVRRLIERALVRAKFDLTLAKFIANLAKWAILAAAVIMCLSEFGIQTATFAVVLGGLSLALGLALQGSLQHVAAGIMLQIFRPFKVGDGISVGGQAGTVNEIDLFTTSLDTADGRRIIIPNGQIFGNIIENQTFHGQRRTDINISLAGSNDVDDVRAVLLEAARRVPNILQAPAPDVVLLDLAGGNLNFSVQVWSKTSDAGGVKQGLAKSVQEALGAAKMGGPRPGMDINVLSLPR